MVFNTSEATDTDSLNEFRFQDLHDTGLGNLSFERVATPKPRVCRQLQVIMGNFLSEAESGHGPGNSFFTCSVVFAVVLGALQISAHQCSNVFLAYASENCIVAQSNRKSPSKTEHAVGKIVE